MHLKLGLTNNPRFGPLVDGSVRSTQCELDIVVTTPPELFYRNLKNDEFDVFEMSLSEYLITRERAAADRWQWCALPIFPAKAFLFLGLYVNPSSGIRGLAGLRGKRVGVPDYVMTAALWFRVFLRELYGIEPRDVSWFIGRTKDLSHGGLLSLDAQPPADVPLTWLSSDQTFDVMLDRGEIDLAYGFAPRHDPKLFSLNIDRYGGTPLEGNPRIAKLFSDGGCAEVKAFFEKTGVVPANHVIVAQRRLLEKHPWLGSEILDLFTASKQSAYERSNYGSPTYRYFEAMDRPAQERLFGKDPYPFGIANNRKMLELLFRSSHDQGLTKRLASIDEVFHPGLLDT